MVDYLSRRLEYERNIGNIHSFRIVRGIKDMNHYKFADDTLLLGGANIHSAEHFKQELEIYKEVSGSKINFQKSKIFS